MKDRKVGGGGMRESVKETSVGLWGQAGQRKQGNMRGYGGEKGNVRNSNGETKKRKQQIRSCPVGTQN